MSSLNIGTVYSCTREKYPMDTHLKGRLLCRWFDETFSQSPQTAISLMFFVRDIWGGYGARKAFNILFQHFVNLVGRLAFPYICFFPIYGRWDDIINLLDAEYIKDKEVFSDMKDYIAECVISRLEADMREVESGNYPLYNLSSLALFMPSENASSEKTRRKARFFIKKMGLRRHPDKYRKMLTKLRQEVRCKSYPEMIDMLNVTGAANRYKEFVGNNYHNFSRFNSLKIGNFAICTVKFSNPNFDQNDDKFIKAAEISYYFSTNMMGEYFGWQYTLNDSGGIFSKISHKPFEDFYYNCVRSSLYTLDIEELFKNLLRFGRDRKDSVHFPAFFIIITDKPLWYWNREKMKQVYRNAKKKWLNKGRTLDYLPPRLVYWNISPLSNEDCPVEFLDNGLVFLQGMYPTIIEQIFNDVPVDNVSELQARLCSNGRYDYLPKLKDMA